MLSISSDMKKCSYEDCRGKEAKPEHPQRAPHSPLHIIRELHRFETIAFSTLGSPEHEESLLRTLSPLEKVR